MSARLPTLNLLGLPGRSGEPAEPARIRERDGLVPRHRGTLEDVVRLDLLLHQLLDPRKILRRDPVRQIHIVVKPVLHRRPRGKLRLRPDAQDRRRQHMRRAMAQALDVGHLVALFGCLAVVGHKKWAAKLANERSEARQGTKSHPERSDAAGAGGAARSRGTRSHRSGLPLVEPRQGTSRCGCG